MTSEELLDLARELTPTEFSDKILLMWMSNCENSILVDVIGLDPSNCKRQLRRNSGKLLVPEPYDKLYLPYMQAQISHANDEPDRYANYMALYQTYVDEYARWYLEMRDGLRKRRDANIFLSAYAIAVSHGFVGSEEEWLDSLYARVTPEQAGEALSEYIAENPEAGGYVRYTAPQRLTLEQAAQARENIMAPGKQDFDELERVVDQMDQHFLSLDPQELTEEQQLQLRANINAVSSEALARLLEAVNESFGELEEQVIKNTAQTLTPEQMEQARKNIGAQGVAQVQDAVNDAITDAMSNAVQIVPQKLTEAEKAKARGNIGAISAQEVAELVPVDATLTKAGQAADAAATGFAIVSLSESVSDVAARIGGLSFSVDADGVLNVTYDEEVADDGNG